MGDYFKGASLVVLGETLAGRRVHKHSLPCPLQECAYPLASGSGNDNNTTHSVVVTGHPDAVQCLWQRFMPLSTSSQQRLLVLSLIRSHHCDFTGQSWRNNLYKGKVLVLPLPAETRCTVALIIQGKSTSVNTVCQVKVKIRSHSIKQDSIAYRLSIEKSALFIACLPSLSLLTGETRHCSLKSILKYFSGYTKNTGSAAISRVRER